MGIAYYQPSFENQFLGAKLANLSTDNLTVGLIASGTIAARSVTENYVYVSDFLNNNGSALTEVTGGNYSRKSLSSVSYSASGLTVTLTAANPTWANATFSAVYGWLYDATIGSGDSSHPLIVLWDFSGAQAVTATNFTLQLSASGIVTWATTP